MLRVFLGARARRAGCRAPRPKVHESCSLFGGGRPSALRLAVALLAGVVLASTPKSTVARPYRVVVVAGDGALNSLPSGAAHEPVARVADGAGKPVSGARVEFDAPKAGPGVTFGGATHLAITTNSAGLAKAAGVRNNGVAGGFILLVHVSYQGEAIGEMAVHQTNVTSKMAHLSNHMHQQEQFPDAAISTAAVGIALGDQFLINGTVTPTNATLAPGNRVQTQNTPVTIYIHDHCEFLIGPHSSVIIQPHQVSVTSGAVRAKHFGDCKFGSGGLWVTSPAPNGDAVVALSREHMEVGSVSGPVEIANEIKVVGMVQPGTVSAFNFNPAASASGASVSAPTSKKVVFMLGLGTGAALAGLGLSVAAIVQPEPASTSP